MSDLNEYTVTTSDWRSNLRQNNTRTVFIILMFFAIYLAIGLLVDTALTAEKYPSLDIPTILKALVTLQIFPIATAIMALVAGISLFVSYAMYDRLMLLGTEYHEITPETASNNQEKQLYNVVEEMKVAAGLRFMPKVYLIEADYMNAFASGYSEKSAMVAITRGLIDKLDRDELTAVMAHEVSHILHMDIKVTLTASLLANLSLMVIDMLFWGVIYGRSNNNEQRSRGGLMIIIMILRYVLPIINVVLLMYLSRRRELMADAGCVQLMRANEPLARALLKISNDSETNKDKYSIQYQQTPHENVRREAYIFDPIQAGIEPVSSIAELFSTHPTLETRLKALGFTRKD